VDDPGGANEVAQGASSSAVLQIAREGAGRPFLFPGKRGGKPLAHTAMAVLLRERAPPVATVHGFRATFKSWAEDKTDHAREVIEAALAHTIGDKAEQAYRRSDALDKRRALMGEWSAFLG
jgi:integrase